MSKQIIALGGGGFLMEPENPLLDLYILNQTHKTKPKVCFLPTAAGDSDKIQLNFYAAFTQYSCEPSIFSFFRPPTHDFEDFLLEKDIIYVGGGNTFNMLAIWKAWGVDQTLKKAWENQIVLAGVSAGAICWFEQGHTDSFSVNNLSGIPCLGFLKGSCSPHFDSPQENRRASYTQLITDGKMIPGYGLDDGVAIHYKDDEVYKIVSSRENAYAHFIDQEKEEILSPEFLGQKS